MTGEELQRKFGSKYINEKEKALELIAFKRIAKNLSKIVSEYEEAHGGDISTDIALRFFIEDGYVGTNSNTFHKPAVFINDAVFEKYISKRKGKGKPIFFTAGGTGAGKTSSLKFIDRRKMAFSYDSNLAVLEKAITKIDAAKAAGYEIFIAYVHRPMIDAFENGVIKRALSFLNDNEPPRTIPIPAHIKTHVECPKVGLQIYKHYAQYANIDFQVFNNSLEEGKATIVPISFLETQIYNLEDRESLTQQLHDIADKKFKNSEISEKIYQSLINQEKE